MYKRFQTKGSLFEQPLFSQKAVLSEDSWVWLNIKKKNYEIIKTYMFISTMSETAKANRALCFSNAVSSWKWEKTKTKKHYDRRYSRRGISFIKYHILIQNKNLKWKFSYPVAHKQIPVKGTDMSGPQHFKNVQKHIPVINWSAKELQC